ncbi:hypothetical protein SLEP1_g25830 [Rubroshorea leprosula]|uniref:F-box domain-containing protein n=1 Tax=Rubroshorea leprosula TaxID=152421 RepID=A0AAV5JUK1_9ROSI|nr:hypothetical protein SLEP1_g25830 [Rubroshorea leprosula]
MDAEEGREKKRINLADDPSSRAMIRRDLHRLPPEMLFEILSRLPITSLIQFKTTSHTGYNLIADPRLPPMFRNRVSDSDPCLILFNYNSPVSRRLYFLDSEGCSRGVRKIDPPKHSEVYNLVGSCNGLLCLSFLIIGGSSVSHSLLVYNPFVGDAVRVPTANRFRNQREVFGFGFHPRTGEFKVVRIVYYWKIRMVADPELIVEEVNEGFATVYESMVQVFTVRTTEWRYKGAPPPQLTDKIGPPETLVEGSLHWVTVVGMGGVGPIFGIISFDLADEVFREIPHPPCQRLVSRGYSLSVLNGCLSAAGLVDTVHFDIWVMKQYHVKESWVKQFSFDPYFRRGWPTNASGLLRRFPKVICALKNGEILLLYNSSSLVSYDPVENRFKNLQISGLSNPFHALPFLPSLFSAQATMNL